MFCRGGTLWPPPQFVLLLLRSLAMREHVTRLDSGARIDRYVSFVNVLNDAVLIDHEGSAVSKTLLFVEDTIVLHNSAFEITE